MSSRGKDCVSYIYIPSAPHTVMTGQDRTVVVVRLGQEGDRAGGRVEAEVDTKWVGGCRMDGWTDGWTKVNKQLDRP